MSLKIIKIDLFTKQKNVSCTLLLLTTTVTTETEAGHWNKQEPTTVWVEGYSTAPTVAVAEFGAVE